MASTFRLIYRRVVYVPPEDLQRQAAYETQFPNATRGIVMTVCDAMVPIGASLVMELRALGNTDPIQIMYCLPSDLSATSIALLHATDPDVQVIDICRILLDANLLPNDDVAVAFQSFWLKPVALLLSSFDQVMLMDVDNIFLHDPSVLWTAPAYKETGTLFFYDRVVPLDWGLNQKRGDRSYLTTFLDQFSYHTFHLTAPTAPSARLKGSAMYARRTAHEQDSSVVVIDKARAGRNVRNILWYLSTHLRFRQREPFSYGDKEAFWLSFELAQVRYAFSPWAASVVAAAGDMDNHPDTLCGSLAQYVPSTATMPDLLYVNGGDVIDIVDVMGDNHTKLVNDAATDWTARGARLIERIPRFVVPRYTRDKPTSNLTMFDQTCLVHANSTGISPVFVDTATRRIRLAAAVASKMQWT
ncbi:hypothetical protein DYB32_007674 [Aphanomyces invadans]|uniref:Nucleotide-diphospho-sugar transferase domain-containing protein n=1 Tax=Aphanomyces invadans TaxID=157072 RepID=A0A3R6VHS7_9STRA|nr:hypothetical protein DYB32_007674 [Aphanomyces invadans]